MVVAVLITAITVLYKFSFVLVHRQDMVQVSADWVEMESSPYVPGQFQLFQTLNGWPGDRSVFNYNYRDLVTGTNE